MKHQLVRLLQHTILLSLLACFLLLTNACHQPNPLGQPTIITKDHPIDGEATPTFTIQQPAGQPILIEFLPFETEAQLIVHPSDHDQPTIIATEGIRLAPLWYFAEAPEMERALDITIDSQAQTNRARFSLQSYQLLNEADDSLFSSLNDLTQGLTVTPDAGNHPWNQRIEHLLGSEQALKRWNLKEIAGWARLHAAQKAYWQTGAIERPIELVRALNQSHAAVKGSYMEIAVLQLLGACLIERRPDDPPDVAREKMRDGQDLLEQAVRLAQQQSLQFEQAWALNTQGIGHYYQESLGQSAHYYKQAARLASSFSDKPFELQIRGNQALVQERLGNYYDALVELEKIGQLLFKGNNREALANNLYERGRINRDLSDYAEASRLFTDALSIYEQEGDVGGMGRTALSLGITWRQLGYQDRAKEEFLHSIPNLKEAVSGRGLIFAYENLADLGRLQNNFHEMQRFRELQAGQAHTDYDQAVLAYKQGLDAEAMGNFSAAKGYYSQANLKTTNLENPYLAELSHLRLQLLDAKQSQGTLEKSRQAHTTLWQSGKLEHAFEGSWLWAQIQVAHGHYDDGLSTLRESIQRLKALRRQLPESVGAWYWERRQVVFDFYLQAVISTSPVQQKAVDSLKAFSWLTDQALSGIKADLDDKGQRRLRTLIAQMNTEEGLKEGLPIDLIFSGMGLEHSEHVSTYDRLEAAYQEIGVLPDKLKSNQTIAVFYPSDSHSWSWHITDDSIELFALGSGPTLKQNILDTRSSLLTTGDEELENRLAKLGGMLFGEIQEDLEEELWVVATGALKAVPLDALMLDGLHLIEKVTILRAFRLDVFDLPEVFQDMERPPKVMLAGTGEGSIAGNPNLIGADSEISQLEQHLPPGELSTLTGVDFNAENLLSAIPLADIVHIASHVEVNLTNPELSQILLTESGHALTALDLAPLELQASLVVLSGCSTAGADTFSFDHAFGLVGALEFSNHASVIASLWRVSDQKTAQIMLSTYRQLAEKTKSPHVALAKVKREAIVSKAFSVKDWSAFQVFVK